MKQNYRFPSEFREKDHPHEVAAREILGMTGRMVGGSKGRYRRDNPTHLVVFNANLVTKDKKIWYGDLDLTLDLKILNKLAKKINEKIYVLNESDARFDKEEGYNVSEAILTLHSGSGFALKKSEWYYFDDKSGTFRILTKADYDALHPEEAEKVRLEKIARTKEYKESDYVPMIIPDIEEFYSTSKKETPIDKLHKWFISQFDTREQASECLLNMWLPEQWGNDFNALLEKYMRKVMKVKDDYEIEKAVSWATFDLPMNFIGNPEWCEENTGYVKKKSKRNK